MDCQCEKEMHDHLLACKQFLKESHEVTLLANERALMNVSFFGTFEIFVV
jgi:hypothetical protein